MLLLAKPLAEFESSDDADQIYNDFHKKKLKGSRAGPPVLPGRKIYFPKLEAALRISATRAAELLPASIELAQRCRSSAWLDLGATFGAGTFTLGAGAGAFTFFSFLDFLDVAILL